MAKLSRRNFLIGTASAAPFAPAIVKAAGANDRPDIIVFLADDQNYESVNKRDDFYETPNIDALIKRSVLFENSFVTTSICPVSRASIFTGQHAETHGQLGWLWPIRPQPYSRIFPKLLFEAGYNVAFIGKWGVFNKPDLNYFTDFQGFLDQGTYFDKNNPYYHATRQHTDEAIGILSRYRKDSKPFALIVSYKAPHGDDSSPPAWIDLSQKYPEWDVLAEPDGLADYDLVKDLPAFLDKSFGREYGRKMFENSVNFPEYMDAYRKLVFGVDESVGEILSFAQELMPMRRREIIYSSDNGMMTGQHGLLGKWLMYEDSIRVPHMWKPADESKVDEYRKYMEAGHFALNIDIAPTVLAAAGIPVPEIMQGRAHQTVKPDTVRDGFFYSFQVLHGGRLPMVVGWKDRKFKYVRYPNNGNYEQLFAFTDRHDAKDLAKDPQFSGQLEEYRALLDQKLVEFNFKPKKA